MLKSKRQREEPCYLCGHYHDYEGGERCSTCGHVLQQVSVAAEEKSAWPTQILPGFLYLGGFDHASRSDLLKAMDISHILSLVPTCQELYKNTLTYHTIKSTPADFHECFEYIEKARAMRKRILVHCMTGAGKSPAVVIGYLMKLRRWTLKESFVWVKDRHSLTQLSQGEAQRLQALEVQLLGSSLTGFSCTEQPVGASSTGPFSTKWPSQSAAAPSRSTFQVSCMPALAFSPCEDRQREFVFGSSGQSALQPDTGQATMDV